MSRVIVPITGSKDSSHYTIDEGANIGIPNEIATQIVKFLTDQGFLIEVVKPRQKVQDGAKSTNYTPKNACRVVETFLAIDLIDEFVSNDMRPAIVKAAEGRKKTIKGRLAKLK
jgi:predicted CoA-binding protein